MSYHEYPRNRDEPIDSIDATQNHTSRYVLGFGLSGAILVLIAAIFLALY